MHFHTNPINQEKTNATSRKLDFLRSKNGRPGLLPIPWPISTRGEKKRILRCNNCNSSRSLPRTRLNFPSRNKTNCRRTLVCYFPEIKYCSLHLCIRVVSSNNKFLLSPFGCKIFDRDTFRNTLATSAVSLSQQSKERRLLSINFLYLFEFSFYSYPWNCLSDFIPENFAAVK